MTIHNDFPLSEILWYRIGGAVKYLLEVQSKEDIFEAFDFIQKQNIQKWFIVGTGSNLLVSDSYFDGAVIHLLRKVDPKHIHLTNDGMVEAFSGELLDDVIHFCFNNNLIGLEWSGGLPGTVGAGVRGNVGAFGSEIKDSLYTTEVLSIANGEKEVRTLTNSDCQFGYRKSAIKENKNYIVLSAQFKFKKVEGEELEKAKKIYRDNIRYREERHPLEYPNSGSVFKNIVKSEEVSKVLSVFPDLSESVQTKWHGKVAMAAVIEKLGFSGFQIGNAQVSTKHANFIVNLGGASFNDVFQIIETIKQKFSETFGFPPEVEIEIVQ